MKTFWEKVETVAKGLGYKDGTIRIWRHRGKVPTSHHYAFSQEAPKFGTRLSLKELNKTVPE